MCPLMVVMIDISVQISLQGLKVAINLFPKRDPVKLIQNRLMKPLANPVGLRTSSFGLCMLNLIELQIKLIRMLIRRSAIFRPPIR